MAEKKTENKKLKEILFDLKSNDDKKVAKAIKALEKNGNSSVIKSIADVLLGEMSEKNRSSLIEILCSLKDSSVTAEIMDVLESEKYLSIRTVVLSAIWNMKVDFSDYISEFVEIAVNGDFMDTLECLTIIENLEGPFLEEDVLDAQLHLKAYLERDEKDKDDQKSHFLSEIAIKVKEINESLMD